MFDRRRTGYALTETGREILPLAEAAEAAVARIDDALASRSRRLAGTIRVTAAEPLANLFLAPAVVAFRRTHPDVEVQLLLTDEFLDLGAGEADVALRATIDGLEDSELVGRRLGKAPWGVYCSRGYAAQAGLPRSVADLDGHAILGSEGQVGAFPALLWLEQVAPTAKVVWRSNSLASLQSAVRAGLGVATLPCLLGRNDPELVKCFDAGGANRPELWILAHPSARRLPHVRAFVQALTEHVIANADQLHDGEPERDADAGRPTKPASRSPGRAASTG